MLLLIFHEGHARPAAVDLSAEIGDLGKTDIVVTGFVESKCTLLDINDEENLEVWR